MRAGEAMPAEITNSQCHCAACMQIAMATCDRPDDVTSEPADVVDRHHGSEGRGLACRQLQITSQHQQHRQCSIARLERHPIHRSNFLPSSNCPRSSTAAQRALGSVLTRPKKKIESKEDVITWRTRYWAILELAKVAKAREK